MMSPPETINGCLVSGFVSWKHLRRNMTPPSLYDRLKQIPGFDAKELAWDFKREDQIGDDMSQADLEAWVHAHRLREEQWFRVAETMLRDETPDLFAVMFDGTDKLQHQTWHVLDPSLQPEHPTRRARPLTGADARLLSTARRIHRTARRTRRTGSAGVHCIRPRVYGNIQRGADQPATSASLAI